MSEHEDAAPQQDSADAHRSGAGRHGDDELVSRLRVIEDQPLASRAEALAHLHDELRAQLEAGDGPRAHA
ncbi:MAG: hypothetical protein CMF56_01575 [Leifsonia sp.]|nr:hypothetical protein [Leifsonia sp.]|tara:strand:+ start:3475 stop:3684 length:210 start_codon:yes stop_codon:yes gene_type:complete